MSDLPAEKTDIVFVASPTNARSVYMPFYYLYLAGYPEKHGFSVEILDPHHKSYEDNTTEILAWISARKPRFVGLAAFVTDFDAVTALASEIKKHSTAIILAGNAHPSIAPEDFLYKDSPFDIVVRGEGEKTVKLLLESYNKDADNSGIPGIAYYEAGAVKITRNRELMDLAECGMPAYHKIDMTWYQKPTKHVIRRIAAVAAVIYTGRGCPFKCSFCAANSVWQANDTAPGAPIVRKRPLPQVIEELRMLQDVYGFDFFYILDDTFGIRENDISDFCRAYRDSGLKMLWAAETRVNCIKNDEIVKLLKDSGCIQLDFGVETGSPRLLKLINKTTTVEQTKHAFALCRKYGLRTFANVLLNLPTEKEEDLALTEKLLGEIKPTYISVGVTQPYPGTDICKQLDRPVSKNDYTKLSRLLPTEEYRLSSHKLDLKKLLFRWFGKYGIAAPFERSLFKADERYWRKIFGSEHRLAYAYYLLKDVLLSPLHYLVHLKLYLLDNSD
jgi:radical SAM superfamily enzyme YgiQ (UPF0313 family)